MQDAPFQDSRAGSEEDMLEYDDDMPIFSCRSCSKRRRLTVAEKALIAFGILCLIIIIILAANMGKKHEKKGKAWRAKRFIVVIINTVTTYDTSSF